MKYTKKNIITCEEYTETLLSDFNNKESNAFGRVYDIFYNDMFYFSSKLYNDTNIEPQDIVHDTFLKLWQAKSAKFNSLIDIKAYLFISIRNDFNNFITHNKHVEKYKKYHEDNVKQFEADVIESELFCYFNYILELLPEENAEILKLFFYGWSAEEIAEKLNKNKQTIYNKKHESLIFLRNKISKDKLLIFIILFS